MCFFLYFFGGWWLYLLSLRYEIMNIFVFLKLMDGMDISTYMRNQAYVDLNSRYQFSHFKCPYCKKMCLVEDAKIEIVEIQTPEDSYSFGGATTTRYRIDRYKYRVCKSCDSKKNKYIKVELLLWTFLVVVSYVWFVFHYFTQVETFGVLGKLEERDCWEFLGWSALLFFVVYMLLFWVLHFLSLLLGRPYKRMTLDEVIRANALKY